MSFESKLVVDSKMSPSNDLKHHDAFETGGIFSTGAALSAEEDRRILRKIDLKCVLAHSSKVKSNTNYRQPPSCVSSILSISVLRQVCSRIHRDYGVENRPFHDRIRVLLV